VNNALPASESSRDFRVFLRGLVELTKPGVTRMVLVTTAFGAIIAPGKVALGRLAVTLIATGAVVGAANALNMYWERDVDGLMRRTEGRPIPSGRVSSEAALWFGACLALLGLTALALFVNPVATLLAATGFVSYVFLYTPLKRSTPYALQIGTIPGAIPPLIGWAAMTGDLSLAAFSLFALQVVWQIPHFLAISIFRRGEYAGAGFAVYPLVQGVPATKRAIVSYSLLLLLASVAPVLFGLGGPVYLVVAIVLGSIQVVVAIRGLGVSDLDKWARRLFFATLPYLTCVYLALALASR
jgi:protoheme IX farnesyltransferase